MPALQTASRLSPPPSAFDAVDALVKSWAEEVTEDAGRFDDCYGSQVEEIENR